MTQNMPEETALHRVGSFAELKAGQSMRASVNGTRIAVFLNDGAPIATAARCPHAQGPLHEGEVEAGILTCPWHGWTFDLASGACDDDPSLVLQRYETVVDGDDILVRL
ncbi:Rieske domain-containing protein [Novosphingobium lubricantis]